MITNNEDKSMNMNQGELFTMEELIHAPKAMIIKPLDKIKDATIIQLRDFIVKSMFMNDDDTAMVNSRTVAIHFDMKHKDVLRKIRETEELLIELGDDTDEKDGRNYSPIFYLDEYGREKPCYDMNFDSFNVLVNRFTGKNSLKYGLAYNQAFKVMTAKTKELVKQDQRKLPQDYLEALKELTSTEEQRLIEQNGRIIAENRLIEQNYKTEHWKGQNKKKGGALGGKQKGYNAAKRKINKLEQVIVQKDVDHKIEIDQKDVEIQNLKKSKSKFDKITEIMRNR